MKKRIFGLDLVRSVAIVLVVMVHVMLNTHFVDKPMSGGSDFLLLFIRSICLSCVPLFIMLTGYCKSEKKLNKEHYKSLKKILISYFVIAILTVLYELFYKKIDFDFTRHILGIFSFSINEYAWYIEMYIGLFLLIPFLNILYQNLETKKQKHILFLSLLAICSFPQTVEKLWVADYQLDILPKYWGVLYPVLYYYIGCYIKEYQVSINKHINRIVIIVLAFLQTMIAYYSAHTEYLIDRTLPEYTSIITIIISTLIFIDLYQIKIRGNKIRNIVKSISINTLEMYLISFILDDLFYSLWITGENITRNALKGFVFCFPTVLILSYLLAVIINKLISLITKLIHSIKSHHEKRYSSLESY